MVIASAYISRRPADREHPFGHGRAELIGALVIAVLLGVTALEFAKSSVLSILHPQALNAPWWLIGLVAASALGKLWLSAFAAKLGRLAGNKAIEADAAHHMSDVLATGLVVLAMIAARYQLLWLDGLAGLLVSVIIAWTAWHIARESIGPLLGQAPDAAELHDIASQARSFAQVLGVHDIIVHKYGHMRVVSLHIEVSEALGVQQAHTLAEQVQERLCKNSQDMAVVHVDPVNDQHPHYDTLQQILRDFVQNEPRIESFYDLRIVGEAQAFSVLVELGSKGALSTQDIDFINKNLLNAIQQDFAAAQLVLKVEALIAGI